MNAPVPQPMTQLSAQELHFWRGERHVLRGVSLRVEAGQCLQVCGHNGAGKTTLLRTLCGLTWLEEGAVYWRGRNIREDLLAFHAELGYLGHDNALKADLTASENLHFGAGLRRVLSHADIETALHRLGVAECAARPTRRLSAGQRRRVALARLSLLRATLWILDEPTSNLDAAGQRVVHELLADHLAQGGAAIVATHQTLPLPAERYSVLTLQ